MIMIGGAITTPAASESPLPKPTGPIILTITGAIEHVNAEGRAEFDRAMLKALGTTSFATTTSWTDGKPEFEGVLVRDVLRAVGATGSSIEAIAINDYSVKIPLSDFDRYDVLLALNMNGKKLTHRDKGPIWIVYPRDDHDELHTASTDAKWIWQLTKIDVR